MPLKNYCYSIKLVNPAKKSEYRVHNVRDCSKFVNKEQLEGFVKLTFKEYQLLCMGYVEPGHGWKGKQRWLNSDNDIVELYRTYQEKTKDILLWCHLPSTQKSRKRSAKQKPSSDEPQSKRSQSIINDEKTSEANKIFKSLSEKHESRYTPEQLHAWAHLIELKKHTLLEDPPDYQYFRGNKQKKKEELQSTNLSNPERTAELTTGFLLRKKLIIMRTECIDQLQKISDLFDKGCISQHHYENLQETIMVAKNCTT